MSAGMHRTFMLRSKTFQIRQMIFSVGFFNSHAVNIKTKRGYRARSSGIKFRDAASITFHALNQRLVYAFGKRSFNTLSHEFLRAAHYRFFRNLLSADIKVPAKRLKILNDLCRRAEFAPSELRDLMKRPSQTNRFLNIVHVLLLTC